MSDDATTLSKLCISCGLCCSGALFADVRLHKKDDIQSLDEAGLAIEERGKNLHLLQPCPALHRGRCGVYETRPTNCRRFICTVATRVKNKDLNLDEATKVIRNAKQRISRLEKLLEQLGNHETDLPITWRYEDVFAQPWDSDASGDLFEKRSRLYRMSTSLAQFLDSNFMQPAVSDQPER